MDNKELRIEIPKGFEIGEFDIKTGTVKFKAVKKEITEDSTFQDVLNYLGADDKEVVEYNKLVKASITSKALYFQMAVCVVRALNQKHELDWNNKNEYKYYIWWYMNEFRFDDSYYSYVSSNAPSLLCFKNTKIIEIVKKNKEFTEIFKQFML